MDAGTRRIENYHIRLTVLIDEITSQDILHITGEELTISDAVTGRVHLRILNRLRNIFNADNSSGLAGDELRDRAGPCVEVIDDLVAGQLSKIPRDRVKLVGLLGVGLVERLRTYAESQAFHCLTDCRLTLVENALLITDRVIQLIVDDIVKRCDLRKRFSNGIQHFLPVLTVLVEEAHYHHQVARVGRADEHIPDIAHVLTDVKEIQTVFDSILLDEKPDVIGRILLKVAVLDVQHLVEELTYVESKSHTVVLRNALNVLVLQQPSFR